jgi:hypothetical protein
LEPASAPLSIAIVIQVNQDLRQYLGFISKTGSVVDALGFRAGVDLGKLVAALNRKAEAATETDPRKAITTASGGTQLRFRTQRELEGGMSAIGFQMRSAYVLSYYPRSAELGRHSTEVEVDVPRAKVYSRSGYWLADN